MQDGLEGEKLEWRLVRWLSHYGECSSSVSCLSTAVTKFPGGRVLL